MAEGDAPGEKGQFYFGELDGQSRVRTRQIEALFASSELKVHIESDMDGWLKYHFAFIGPMAGAAYKHGLDFGAVAGDKDTLHEFCKACREAGNVLRELGYERRQPPIFNAFYWLPHWLETMVFARLFGAPSAQIRFGLHAAVVRPELLALVEDFAELRSRAGLETPTLDGLLSYLEPSLETNRPARVA